MPTERSVRNIIVAVQMCQRCKGPHDFPVEVIIDRTVGVVALSGPKMEVCDVVLTCPSTGKDIVVSVPVALEALETLVRAQAKR